MEGERVLANYLEQLLCQETQWARANSSIELIRSKKRGRKSSGQLKPIGNKIWRTLNIYGWGLQKIRSFHQAWDRDDWVGALCADFWGNKLELPVWEAKAGRGKWGTQRGYRQPLEQTKQSQAASQQEWLDKAGETYVSADSNHLREVCFDQAARHRLRQLRKKICCEAYRDARKGKV